MARDLMCESIAEVQKNPDWPKLSPTDRLRVAWILGWRSAIEQARIELEAKGHHDASKRLQECAKQPGHVH